ncbi:glycosyltransferase [Nocardia vinacea]|uniref:glycosyltransferase n=1 Tax=Nocardia vinacea TaxID=96468 RepID=UPI0002EE4331|nr:glycosyltransferase [Nocardia vinacea]
MRILFVATPLIGHLFPMMPLAEYLHRSGQQVAIATGGDAVVAGKAGIPVRDVWPRVPMLPAIARALAFHPRAAVRSGLGVADADGAGRVFAHINRPAVEAVAQATKSFAPDLVVHEPFAAAGTVAAARYGIPSVLHNIAFDNGTRVCEQILRHMGRTYPAPEPAAAISIAPPSLVSVPGRPMRPVPYSAPGACTPEDLLQAPSRPRILVTRSTMLGDGPDGMTASIIRAAPAVDAEFVIVRPNRRVQRANDLPPNITTVGWTVLSDVLRNCHGVVNHGGAGSVYAALATGVPQIVTPAPGDRRWNATLVERRGAGFSRRPRRIDPRSLTDLITGREVALAAKQVADEIAAMPSVEDVASELIAMARP